jgi:hypothetical protein
MTDCGELNGDCASIADEANYNSMLNSKPLPVLPTGGNMWMENGERCYARWFPKHHAPIGEPLAHNRAR